MAAPTSTPTLPLPDDQNPVLAAPQHGSGSIGPFFAVMTVIVVLSALSCVFGRYCASLAEGPDAWYDWGGWARRRCGRWYRSALDLGRGAKTAVNLELDTNIREGKQLSLPRP